MNRLDVRRAAELAERTAAQRWLIEGLWSESAVGGEFQESCRLVI